MPVTTSILQGDALAVLAGLPGNHFHCCVTSPPYWGLRDYGLPPSVWGGDAGCSHEWAETAVATEVGRGNWAQAVNGRGEAQGDAATFREPIRSSSVQGFCIRCGAWRGCLGLEPSPALFVEHLASIFRAVRRVLRPDGSLWVNMGDTYNAYNGNRGPSTSFSDGTDGRGHPCHRRGLMSDSLKPKDLVGIPWRLAFALQDDGWYLRSDIIWSKSNPMPESVTDRPTKAHEYIFLLTKSARYFYDAEAVKEPCTDVSTARRGRNDFRDKPGLEEAYHGNAPKGLNNGNVTAMRNKRSVWEIPTQSYSGAHFATFPEELPQTCILAGTSARGCCSVCGSPWRRVMERTEAPDVSAKGSRFDQGKTGARDGGGRTQAGERCLKVAAGWEAGCSCADAEVVPCRVLEPFCGSGTTLAVAHRLGRSGLGIELNPEYVEMAERRIAKETPALDLF